MFTPARKLEHPGARKVMGGSMRNAYGKEAQESYERVLID